MRKLKLLLVTLALIVGGALSANAYTKTDLTSAGWTELTDLSAITLEDNLFVFFDSSSDLMLSLETGVHQGNDKKALFYKTAANPLVDFTKLFAIEAGGSNGTYALRNASLDFRKLQLQTEWNAGWYYRTNDQPNSCQWTRIKLAYAEGSWTIQNNEYSGYLGKWDGGTTYADGDETAANKTGGDIGHYKIYYMAKGDIISKLLNANAPTKAAPTDLSVVTAGKTNTTSGWTKNFENFTQNFQPTRNNTKNTGSYSNWGFLEAWNNSVVFTGTLTTALAYMPNGMYKITAYAFKETTDVISLNGGDNNVSTSLTNTDNKYQEVVIDNVNVTEGNGLTLGLNVTSGTWIGITDIRVSYYGPNLAKDAVALPAGGAMTANTWYYFDITSDSQYDLTATTLDNIVYTKNASILIEDQATITTNFSSTNPVALTAGRYYIKSSSANNFAFEAHVKSYSVGDVTATSIADNTYLQSLTTATFTLGDAASNDGTATLAIQGSPVAKLNDGTSDVADGALTISGNVVTATYTSVTLDPAKTYSITLPADAVAWDKNTTNKNTEKVITFKTPALFDGTYFIATSDGAQFISRGGNSNTEAILDEFGIAATFTTDGDNVTTITFVDNNKHLAGGSQSVYNDKTRTELEGEEAGKGARANWTITANADGYNIYSNKWSKYIGKGSGAEAPNYATVATYTDATPYKWMLVTPAAHATTVADYKDANAAAVATAANAAGITAVAGKTTVTALKAVVEGAGWVGKDIAVNNSYSSVAEQYQPNGFAEEIFTQNLTGLENGIYKVKLSIFKRIAGNDATYELYQKNQDSPTAYLFAGSNKAQVPSVMSEYSTEAYTGGWGPNWAKDGKNYPNNTTNAGQAFDAGRYTLEVFAYVNDGTLSVGVKDPAKYSNGNWICYRDLEVTQYKEFTGDYTALAAAITTAEANTLGFENGEYAPYNNVAALTALAAAKTLNTNQNALTQTEIDNATTALTGATWTANAADVECVYNGNFANGQGSAAADIQKYGWTRTNGWGQFRNDGVSSTTGYYNQPGSLQYGNAGVYTMPLAANTIYSLTFKYASWEDNSNGGMTVSVLNGENGMAAKTFEAYKTKYTNGLGEQTILFVTGAAGDYVLTLANSGNTVITGVSITKAANQYLEFADGAPLPKYAPGTYPTVKITRTLTANRWATAVYPFVVNAGVDQIADLSDYNAVTGELSFTSVPASTVNRPFLMLSTAGTSEITLTDVGVEAAAETPIHKRSEASLIGTYVTTTVDNTAKNYVLSNNTIYSIGENNATVNPYRAYIQIEQTSEAPALTFTIDDETTVIEGINANESNDDDAYYNLQGQRVTNPQNGIYIHKGHKIWVK